MKVYRHDESNFLPIPLEQAWKFFSNPDNLNELTPQSMAFENVYALDAPEVYPGMLIVHRISPFPLIKLTWITEITQVAHHLRFVDEQRKGPFALWHHIHEFKAVEGGTVVRDLLYYALPLGVLGQVAHAVQVGAQVKSIFAYRKKRLGEIFPQT